MARERVEAVIELRRAYLRLRRLGQQLSDEDRLELARRLESLTLWAKEAFDWLGERDKGLSEGLTWLHVTGTTLVSNLRAYDAGRHKLMMRILKRGMEGSEEGVSGGSARGSRRDVRSGSRPGLRRTKGKGRDAT
jgi:hypothetical protein